MRFEKYSKYKDSGIEWIGEIPEHWEVMKLKYVVNYQKGKNPLYFTSEVNKNIYLTMEYLRGDVTKAQYINDTTNLIKVQKNDYLLLWDGSNAGEFIKAKEGYLSSTMAVLKIKKEISKHYIWYYLKFMEKELKKLTIGMGIPHVNSQILNNFLFISPPKQEQIQIAKFLDKKTASIDKAIKLKEKLIEKLNELKQSIINEAVTKGLNKDVKYKDSGIKWIGKIPEHWEIVRIKYFAYTKGRIGFHGLKSDESLYEENLPYLVTGTDFKNHKIDWSLCRRVSEKRYEEDPNIHLQKGDLLITKDGTVGKTAIIDYLPYKATLNSGILLVRIKKNICLTKYLFWIINSKVFTIFVDLKNTGATVLHLYQNDFDNFDIPLPTLEEQKEIVDYLEKRINQINKAIELQQKEIEKLKEYKSSLIDSIVTGKIKVF